MKPIGSYSSLGTQSRRFDVDSIPEHLVSRAANGFTSQMVTPSESRKSSPFDRQVFPLSSGLNS